MKKLIKKSMRLALVVLFAFAVNNTAYAQFGNLKKVVKGAVKSAVKEKVEEVKPSVTATDNDPYGGNQVEEMQKRKREASAQQDAEREARAKAGSKITESRRDTQIGAWHYREKRLENTQTGKSYTADYEKGVITSGDGEVVATLTADGLEIPSIDAKIKFTSGGGVTINGESCGKATSQDLYIYGRRLGYFSAEATHALVTFFFLTQTPYGTPEARANMRKTQYMDGTFLDANGSRVGYIKGGQIINNNRLFPKQGNLHYDDDETVIADNSYRVGAFLYDGTVNDNNGNKIGQVKENGDILNISGKKVAHVASDGKITDASGKFLVHFSGNRPVVAAVAYYFFFKDKIR
ncbi:MAG: DUF3659 domain-containing protein [Prevotella sp.]|nr:DUF3659 domain-containing protein [Prevotella sp.]